MLLAATSHQALPMFRTIMLAFVLLLTVSILAVVGIRALRVDHQGLMPRPK
jgi:hypothetical protein